jgi:gas vesicle protein
MSTENIAVLVAVISTFGAIVGVVIGSIVSFLIARLQFKATVISANRHQWINTLRDSIADFQTKAKIAVTEDKLSLHAATAVAADDKGHYEALKTMLFLRNKMALLLNPLEKDHVQLLSSLKELEDFCVNGDPLDDGSYEKLQDSITSTAKIILKREWERVKRGK